MKGIYCLLIDVKRDSLIGVGSLGKLFFRKGSYVYVGSALNNLQKRIARHCRKEKKKHWHIDYLLASRMTAVKKVYLKETNKREECETAEKIAAVGL